MTDKEKELLKATTQFYVVDLQNVGGLITPIIIKITFADGSIEELRIPAEIWRFNCKHVSKLIMTDKEIRSLELDPHLETADVDITNNHFPQR